MRPPTWYWYTYMNSEVLNFYSTNMIAKRRTYRDKRSTGDVEARISARVMLFDNQF